jgi:hypothetical protein
MSQTVPLRLSNSKPDFEALVMQLQLFLSQKATWIDMLTSGTGETLIEMMAAVGTFNQFAIESAAREAFLETAIRDSSIYAITRMLGVRITRKAPASATVSLTRTGDTSSAYSLPKFSVFDIDGRRFFNREPIVFLSNQSVVETAVLYAGLIKVQTFQANSQVFREIYLNEPGFVVSNYDLEVVMVNPTTDSRELWLPTEDGIWTASAAENVYYDSTSGLGDTILAFGDGYHGSLPAIGFNIEVTYASTDGALGNTGGAGLQVKVVGLDSVNGVTTSPVSGGANEKKSTYYKSLAPNLYKARTRAVTAPDYKAIASSYPGVASVTVMAQRDIAPNDLRWMNVVRLCVLPEFSDAYTVSQWSDFLAWFSKKGHAAVHIQKFDPIKLYADITLVVAIRQTALSSEVLVTVENNIKSLFEKDLSTLGKRIALSDVLEACTVVTGVDYVDPISPLGDFICPTPLHFYELRTLQISVIYSERTFYNVQSFSTS